MRDAWESRAGTTLDEPAAITERQLRSLKRGARAGRMALLLALVAVLAAAWGLIFGSDSLAGVDGIRELRERVLGATGQPAADAAAQSVLASTADTLGTTPDGAATGP